MNAIKHFFKSKTIWAGIIAIVSGVGIYVQTNDSVTLITAVYGFIGIVLRYFTNKPINEK